VLRNIIATDFAEFGAKSEVGKADKGAPEIVGGGGGDDVQNEVEGQERCERGGEGSCKGVGVCVPSLMHVCDVTHVHV